jgi:hypothetical protein
MVESLAEHRPCLEPGSSLQKSSDQPTTKHRVVNSAHFENHQAVFLEGSIRGHVHRVQVLTQGDDLGVDRIGAEELTDALFAIDHRKKDLLAAATRVECKRSRHGGLADATLADHEQEAPV